MPRLRKPGDVIRDYTIVRELNRGGMAISYEARTSGSRSVFFKLYKSPTVQVGWYRDYLAYQSEMRTRIERGSAQNFCYRFIDSFEHERCFYQAFEFLDRSYSLEQILEKCRSSAAPIRPESRLTMAKVLSSGVAALHEAQVVHADLKPDNVMLVKDDSIRAGYRLRLIDMDFSLLRDRTAPWHGESGYFGTDGYLSPEHIRGEVPQPASDVYTVGLMLHELLGGSHPYRSESDYATLCLSGTAKSLRLIAPLDRLPHAVLIAQTVQRCLSPDPAERPMAAEINKVLNGGTTGERPGAETDAKPRSAPPDRIFSKSSLPVRPGEESVPKLKSPAVETGSIAKVDTTLVASAPGSVGRTSHGALMLKSARGNQQTFNIGIRFNQALARQLAPDEAQFVDKERQFELERSAEGWYVTPYSGAVNETLVNGKLIADRKLLQHGDVIGVGRESKGIVKASLTVSFS